MKNLILTEPSLLADLPCDQLEKELLPVVRRLVRTLQTNDASGLSRTYDRAVHQWGDPIGLSIAHLLQRLLSELTKCRGAALECFYPRDRAELQYISQDEYNLLAMLHHMRRDETSCARCFAEELTHGNVGSKAVRTGWTFAKRYSPGAIPSARNTRKSVRLRVVEQ